MLILTRRISETLVIGDDEVNITVLGVKGNQIRLGINSLPSISIHRQEIYQKIKSEEEQRRSQSIDAIKPGKGFIGKLAAHLKPLISTQVTH
jgi:carbon storage regulator